MMSQARFRKPLFFAAFGHPVVALSCGCVGILPNKYFARRFLERLFSHSFF